MMPDITIVTDSDKILLQDIRHLIEEARDSVAVTVNAQLTLLYWKIRDRIHREILKGDRADYGQKILATLSQELTMVYGKGSVISH